MFISKLINDIKEKSIKKVFLFIFMCFCVACTLKNTLYKDFFILYASGYWWKD